MNQISTLDFARRNIWEDNVRMIQKHNLEADMGLHTFTMKVNHFADLVSYSVFTLKYALNMSQSSIDE